MARITATERNAVLCSWWIWGSRWDGKRRWGGCWRTQALARWQDPWPGGWDLAQLDVGFYVQDAVSQTEGTSFSQVEVDFALKYASLWPFSGHNPVLSAPATELACLWLAGSLHAQWQQRLIPRQVLNKGCLSEGLGISVNKAWPGRLWLLANGTGKPKIPLHWAERQELGLPPAEQVDCVSHGSKEQLAPAHGKQKAKKEMCKSSLSALISLGGLYRRALRVLDALRSLYNQASLQQRTGPSGIRGNHVAKAALPLPAPDLTRLRAPMNHTLAVCKALQKCRLWKLSAQEILVISDHSGIVGKEGGMWDESAHPRHFTEEHCHTSRTRTQVLLP